MQKYNVFTDFHHASLLNSLIMLFEGRFGGNVYRPIGIEWANKGYWRVYDHPATQMQFLTLDQGYKPIDGTPPLNQFAENVPNPQEGVYYCQDIDSGKYNKAITLEKFLELPIDIVIASMPQHIEPFKKLCERHPNKPKMIFQIGNAWSVEAGQAPNVMASAKIDNVPDGVHFISYHQEFDTEIFSPLTKIIHEDGELTFPEKNVYSFVNCFNVMNHFAQDWELFQKMERLMPDWNFKSYGGQCRDGAAHGTKELADKMRESRFIWHTKVGGDGYGHIIHNAAAVGRPLIVKKSQYAGKLAEPLLADGVTCIDIEQMPPDHAMTKIMHYSQPELYARMVKNTHFYFRKVVNFNEEAKRLAKFLENLV